MKKSGRGSEWRQSNNAQTVVDADGSQLVLGARVSDCADDKRELVADVDSVPKSVGLIERALADSGYASGRPTLPRILNGCRPEFKPGAPP